MANFKIYNLFATVIIYITLVILIQSCARQGSPTGGPKDTAPPVALQSKPVNYSTNFKQKQISILFDEYITLKNVTQELLISPPLPEKPKLKQRGKYLIIDLNNQLKDSTTYNINFYDAIVDLNEGNPLTNFQFEFSTGPVFDSMYISGTLRDAFNFKTEKGLKVMLYSNFNDTIPRKTLPDYVAKTDKDGNFMISNFKNKPYYLFALNDMNNNLLFDLPNESIAFIDTAFTAGYQYTTVTDTFKVIDKITNNLNDTIYRDSLVEHGKWVTTLGNINMFLFTEFFQKQYYKQSLRPERQQIIFAFNSNVDSMFNIKIVDTLPIKKNWFIHEKLAKNDSLIFWITDSTLYNRDTLLFAIDYTMPDSVNNPYLRTDTIRLIYKPKADKSNNNNENQKRGGLAGFFSDKPDEIVVDTTPPPSELKILSNASTSFNQDNNVNLDTRFPIKSFDINKIKLVKVIDDTIEKPVIYKVIADTNSMRKYYFEFDKLDNENFKLELYPGAFTDIYNNTNDTVKYKIKTRGLESYSTIKLAIKGVLEQSVLQLLDSKENIIKETYIAGDTVINFEHMEPVQYIFKLFYDSNGNKKWDTGNFLELRQPEQVFYFQQEIKTKSNFDYEYEWDLYPVKE